jgi:hypothetical protein
LRARCDVMADRSDREQEQPTECRRRHSLISRMGPCSRTPSGPAVSTDCVNRPDRRLHPTNATASNLPLQRGGHPQKIFNRGTDICFGVVTVFKNPNLSRLTCQNTIKSFRLSKLIAEISPAAPWRADYSDIADRSGPRWAASPVVFVSKRENQRHRSA